MHKPAFKNLFTLWVIASCLLFTAASLKAQEASPTETNTAKATLFYESKDHSPPRWDLSEEPGVFLYAEQLRIQRPHDKIVYIAYGPLGDVAWYLQNIKGWLKRVTPVEENQIHTFDGGREKELRYEAWLVPEGVELPKVTKPPVEDERAVIEFSSLPYDNVCELCGAKGRRVLEALIEALRERSQRKAYLEFYGCGGSLRHRSSVARHEVKMVKQILIKQGGVEPSRILVKMNMRGKQRCEARIRLTAATPKFL